MSDQFQRSNSNELLKGKEMELNQTNYICKDPSLIYFRRLFTLDSFETPNCETICVLLIIIEWVIFCF